MQNFRWQFRARIVASVSTVFSALSLLRSGWGLIGMIIWSIAEAYMQQTQENKSSPASVGTANTEGVLMAQVDMWIQTIAVLVISVVCFWTDLLLLKATDQQNADLVTALGRAKLWRNVAFILTVLWLIASFYVGYVGLPVFCVLILIWIMIRVGAIFVVWMFIAELKDTISHSAFKNP